MTGNNNILRAIKLRYSGQELEYYLAAWEKYPTLKSDCAIKAREKEYKREQYVKRLKKQ